MKINGKDFNVKADQSLEEINNNLSKMLNPSEQASLMDLFIPKAHAWVGIALVASFVGLFIVLPIWAQLSAINSVTDNLNATIKECENRDESVPFEESETNVLLQKINVPKNNTVKFPEVESSTECSSWAGRVVSICKSHDIGVSTDTAVEWCFAIKKSNKCVEDYKANRPKKASNGKIKKSSEKGAAGVN